jgi:hypothetical protein
VSPVEIRDHRAKGLCFKCDEKWNPAHCCCSKVLLLFRDEDNAPDIKHEDHPPGDISSDILNLHALSCQIHNCSLCVTGVYQHHNFSILIDNGSTHNFIKAALEERLGVEPSWFAPML